MSTPRRSARNARNTRSRRTTTVEEYRETFKVGTAVEVSSEDSGLRGSWFTATVKRQISPKTLKILVEYHNLVDDDDDTKQLLEPVDAVLIRPIPPVDPDRVFAVMEDVDAYHNDGWWEGVVMNVVDEVAGVYSVFFRCSREEINIGRADLRLHREWLGGGLWNPPLEGELVAGESSTSGQKRKRGDDGDDRGGSTSGSGQRKERGSGSGSGQRKQGGSGSGSGQRKEVGSGSGQRKEGGNGAGTATATATGTGTATGTSAGGHRVVMNNGGNREKMHNSNRSLSVVGMEKQRVCSNGVTRYGLLKEPRTRAASHTGGRVSRK